MPTWTSHRTMTSQICHKLPTWTSHKKLPTPTSHRLPTSTCWPFLLISTLWQFYSSSLLLVLLLQFSYPFWRNLNSIMTFSKTMPIRFQNVIANVIWEIINWLKFVQFEIITNIFPLIFSLNFPTLLNYQDVLV